MQKLFGVKYCKVQPCKITRLRPIQQHICNSECNGFLLCASVKVIYQLATHFLQIIKQWIKEHSLIIPTTEADSSLTRSLIFEKLLGSLATGFALYECTGKIHLFFFFLRLRKIHFFLELGRLVECTCSTHVLEKLCC